jgi:drug/metabolite transporter (DMT)-like permease
MQPSSDRRALAVLIFGACMIGFGPVLVRLAVEAGVGPAAAAFWRVSLALPILTGMVLRGRGPASPSLKPAPIAALAGALFAGDLVFWHYGIHFTAIATATVLSNMTPIIVTAVSWVMLREAPKPIFILGMLLAIGGASLMGLSKGGAGVNPALGNLLSAGAAVWYASYMLAVRQARQSMSASVLMLWSSLVGAPLLLACALTLGEPMIPQSALGWAAVAGLGVMHVAGQGSIAWALGRLPAPLAAVVVLVQPVVAAIAGWAVFAEIMTPLQALGGAIALGGVAIAQMSGRSADPGPAAAPKTA